MSEHSLPCGVLIDDPLPRQSELARLRERAEKAESEAQALRDQLKETRAAVVQLAKELIRLGVKVPPRTLVQLREIEDAIAE